MRRTIVRLAGMATCVALATGSAACLNPPVEGPVNATSGAIEQNKPAGVSKCNLTLKAADGSIKTYNFRGDVCKAKKGDPYDLNAQGDLTVSRVNTKTVIQADISKDHCFIRIRDDLSRNTETLGSYTGGFSQDECDQSPHTADRYATTKRYRDLKKGDQYRKETVAYGPAKARELAEADRE